VDSSRLRQALDATSIQSIEDLPAGKTANNARTSSVYTSKPGDAENAMQPIIQRKFEVFNFIVRLSTEGMIIALAAA
jgi:hypothetical protein